MSDKPPYIAVRPFLNELGIAEITRKYRCRLASMLLIELDRRFGEGLKELPCFYDGIRTATDVYIEYLSVPDPIDGLCRESFQAELYDLAADPFQLENLYPTKPGTAERQRQTELKARLDVLRDCAGIEGRDPVPASGHYCE